jgi:hypothetical protein
LIVFILLFTVGIANPLNNYSFLRNLSTIYAPIAVLISYTPLFIQPPNGLISLMKYLLQLWVDTLMAITARSILRCLVGSSIL